ERLHVAIPADPRRGVDVTQRRIFRSGCVGRTASVAHVDVRRHSVVSRHFAEPLNHVVLRVRAAPDRAGKVAEPLIVEPRPPVTLIENIADIDGAAGDWREVHAGKISRAVLNPAACVIAGWAPIDPVKDEEMRIAVAILALRQIPSELDDVAVSAAALARDLVA